MASYIVREKLSEKEKYNAGSKARQDVEKILIDEGAKPKDLFLESDLQRENQRVLKKIEQHIIMQKKWKNLFGEEKEGDIVYLQFPVKAHTIFLGSALRYAMHRRIKTVAIIHDIEYLRNALFSQNNKQHSMRLKYEEMEAIKYFFKIIVHNDVMKKIMVDKFAVPAEKIVVLKIFDYLISDFTPEKTNDVCDDLIIAGNLDKSKCGYLYKIPKDISVSLYGANFSETNSSNIHYKGAFLPDELPKQMHGKFGLVWDGDDLDKCSGIYGKYLMYNNPHKTSLYLACGIPVIIWDQAALASFVLANDCGLVTDNICHIPKMLSELSEKRYITLCNNARKIGIQMRNGYYLKKAIEMVKEQE